MNCKYLLTVLVTVLVTTPFVADTANAWISKIEADCFGSTCQRDGFTAYSMLTRDGRRIGYGGGWYDRYLAAAAPDAVALAVAYPFQILDDVPTEPNDRRVTDVVSTRSDDE